MGRLWMKKKKMLALVTSLCFTLHAQLSNVYYVGQTMIESGTTFYVQVMIPQNLIQGGIK